jgi:putative methyltransferase (TIGR04325 family)
MSLMQKLRRRLFPPRDVIEGYENDELVETIYRKTIAFQPRGDWPLVNNIGTVLDFGGGAGIHYKVARQAAPDIRWAVVETPAMVRRASELTTNRLKFFSEIEKAANWLESIDLMHSNGAIQYVDDAIGTVKALCAARPAKMVWYRVPVSDGSVREEVQTSFLSHNGPGELETGSDKVVKYTKRWLPEDTFVAAHQGYDLSERGSDPREKGTQHFSFARSA